MQLRDHTFRGVTTSLCPECLGVVPAKILERDGRIYFRKHCPQHGTREDFICSDATQYDQMDFNLPGKIPAEFGVEPRQGCPLDCGLCSEHEQHTCIGLVEITSSCNLNCPLCYAQSGPGGKHLSLAECRRSIDRLVEVEGRPEILQISGGEPTIHPEFNQVLAYACQQPIDIVMVNTNGLRIAHDEALLDLLTQWRTRLEVYFQLDGFRESTSRILRGESLVETKLRALEALGRRGIRTTLVATLHPDTNLDEVGQLLRYGLERPWITGLSLQPATYSGRFVLPEELERRVTFPDVIRALAEQSQGLLVEEDFVPLACAHPNCHQLTYLYRSQGRVVPLTRFIDARRDVHLLANGITFTRAKARAVIEGYAVAGGCCGFATPGAAAAGLPGIDTAELERIAGEFFARAGAESLDPEDVFRITITNFLDAYNFDVRRLMKCCIHHVLPTGHLVPFCAYNVLYRDGHVPLPPLGAEQLLGTAAPL